MNLLTVTTKYFRGAVAELHRVRGPTRNQAVRLSAIVLGFTLVSSLLYGIVDFLLGQGMKVILNFT